jgi:hypothetical protein
MGFLTVENASNTTLQKRMTLPAKPFRQDLQNLLAPESLQQTHAALAGARVGSVLGQLPGHRSKFQESFRTKVRESENSKNRPCLQVNLEMKKERERENLSEED